MKTQTLRLVELFVKIDDLGKRKNIVVRKRGKGRRGLCVSEVVTIYVWFLKDKVRSFGEFYDGINGQFLRQFFPQMPDYSNFLKHLKKASKSIYKMTQRRNRGEEVFYRFDAVAGLQKCSSSNPPNISKDGPMGTFVGFDNLRIEVAHRCRWKAKNC